MNTNVTLNGIKWIKAGEDDKGKAIFALTGPIAAIRAAADQGTAVVVKVQEVAVDAATIVDNGDGTATIDKGRKSEPTKADLQAELQELRALLAAQTAQFRDMNLQPPTAAPTPTAQFGNATVTGWLADGVPKKPTSKVIRAKK